MIYDAIKNVAQKLVWDRC